MQLTSLFIIPLILIAFVCLSIGLAWVIKKTDLLKNLDKHESIEEYPVTSVSAEARPKSIFTFLSSHKFYLHLPLIQALIFYLGCTIVIFLAPADTRGDHLVVLVAYALTAFSILNPIINLFLARWWLNTGLFVLSWFMLYYGLFQTVEFARPGTGEALGAGAMIFFLPMEAAMCLLPITALVRLILFAIRNSSAG